MQNIILHLDMNSYFASVAQQENPKWRGKPLGVCEHLGGIIIAASREAKQWGIKTGTPVWEAKKLYPKIILTKTNAEKYRFYTRKFVEVLSDYSDKVELASIDEAYVDVTKVCNIKDFSASLRGNAPDGSNLFKGLPRHLSDALKTPRNDSMADPFLEAVNIVKVIKQRIKTEVGEWLTVSVGVADNKLLAKIGSNLKKPDGLVVITENENEKIKMQKCGVFCQTKNDLYSQLQLTDIPGIGHRQERRLNELGIVTLADLKNYSQAKLEKIFGIHGRHLYNMGQLSGSFKARVKKEEDIKSIGHMYTLPKEYRKSEFFEPVLYKLCEMVGRRLRKKNLQGSILYCFFRSQEKGKSFGGSKNLGFNVWDGRDIFLQAKEMFKTSYSFDSSGRVFKLIGVTVAGLKPVSGQKSLFGHEEQHRKTVEALDKINSKYGDFTVFRAPILKAGKVFHDSVGFGRVKEL